MAAAKKKKPDRARRWLWGTAGVLLLLAAWLVAGHLFVRPWVERGLARYLVGEVSVGTVIVWPTLTISALDVSVDAPHHDLQATRVDIDLEFLGLFGGQAVAAVSTFGLVADFDQGESATVLRREEEATEPGRPEDGGGGSGDGKRPRSGPPVLRFLDLRIVLRGEEDETTELLRTRELSMAPRARGRLALDAAPGVLATVPFERLTAELLPRSDHMILSSFKLRAFNGMLAGNLDINLRRAGAFNGELDWQFVEVERIWEHYGLPYAEKRRGDLSGRLVFEGYRPSLYALRGSGELKLSRGEFYSPISFKMFLVMRLPALEESQLTRGRIRFSLERARAYIEEMKVYGRAFEWEAQGIITFDGRGDLEIRHGSTTLAMSGTVDNPSVRVLPLNGLTAPIDRLFRDGIDDER